MTQRRAQPQVLGTTRLIGLIGWPVAHSRSPIMQNAAFAASGLDYIYVPLPVAPPDVGAALRGLAALGFAGANVTVPHKEAVVPYLQAASARVRALGSANTIVVQEDGSLWGDSTDGPGLLADLAAHGVETAGQQVLLLGAGGAARAVAHALAEAGAAVAIANRTRERAAALCEAVLAAAPGAQVSAHRFPDDTPALSAAATLVINATSVGLHGGARPAVAWDAALSFGPQQVAYDLVYNPAGSPGSLSAFLACAAAAGARTLDGLGMLVHQGARSFELWTKRAAPVAVMAEAVRWAE